MKITRGLRIKDLLQNWTCALNTSKRVCFSSLRQKYQVKIRCAAGKREKQVFLGLMPWFSNSGPKAPQSTHPSKFAGYFKIPGEIQ